MEGQRLLRGFISARTTHPATTGPVIDEIKKVAANVSALSGQISKLQQENTQSPAPPRPQTPAPITPILRSRPHALPPLPNLLPSKVQGLKSN